MTPEAEGKAIWSAVAAARSAAEAARRAEVAGVKIDAIAWLVEETFGRAKGTGAEKKPRERRKGGAA